MALEFVDSFEHYGTLDPRTKWTQGSGTYGSITNSGRNGKGFAINAAGEIGKTLTYHDEWIVGWAAKVSNAIPNFTSSDFIVIRNGGSSLANIRINADASISVYCNNNGILVATSTSFSLHPDTWYYFELHVIFSGTTNVTVTAELTIDGDEKLNGSVASGMNIVNFLYPFAQANNFLFGSISSANGTTYIDDVYIVSGESTLRGDLKILAIYPNGDAAPNDWTRNSGTNDHYTYVNEHAPDEDTTYLKSNTVNETEDFEWEDVAASVGTIKGYQYSLLVRKDNEGHRAINHTRDGSEEGTKIFLNDDYIYYHKPIDGDISPATFNARTHGFKVKDIT